MKITKAAKGDGYTIALSSDELRLSATALAEFRAAPEERALQRKMAQQAVAALPAPEDDEEPETDDDEEDDDDDALFEKEEDDL